MWGLTCASLLDDSPRQGEDLVRVHVSYRYNVVKARLHLMTTRLADVNAMVGAAAGCPLSTQAVQGVAAVGASLGVGQGALRALGRRAVLVADPRQVCTVHPAARSSRSRIPACCSRCSGRRRGCRASRRRCKPRRRSPSTHDPRSRSLVHICVRWSGVGARKLVLGCLCSVSGEEEAHRS